MVIWVLEAFVAAYLAYLVVVGMEYIWPETPSEPAQPVPVEVDDERV